MTTARPLPPVLRRSVRGVLAGLLTAVFLAPFYLMLRNALMDTQGLTSPHWTWWPSSMHWENFSSLFSDPALHMGQALGNSLLIAGITAPVSTLLASAAGYALARIPVPGRGVLLALVVATLMIPGSVTFVPTFVVVGSMGGVNTLWGIIAPGLFNPFAVLLFRNFYLQFPSEIEEAGRLDGLGWLGLYRRIALPSSGAMLASLGALAFIDELERLPVAAGHRAGPVLVDGPDRPVDVPHLTDRQPARTVRRGRRDHRATGGHVPGRPALHRRRHRHQRAQGLREPPSRAWLRTTGPEPPDSGPFGPGRTTWRSNPHTHPTLGGDKHEIR